MRPAARKWGDEAALNVLTNRSLLVSVVAYSSGISYSAHVVKQQLICTSKSYTASGAVPPEDVVLWQNAVCAGDRATLNAFHELSQVPALGRRLGGVLSGILGYAVVHTKDFELLDWIDASFDRFSYDRLTSEADHRAVGEQGDIAIVAWLFSRWVRLGDGVAYGAASRGHLDLLKFVHDSPELQIQCKEALLRAAAENSHLDVIAFVLDNVRDCRHDMYREEDYREVGFAADDDDAIDFAADDNDGAMDYEAMVEYVPESRSERSVRRNHDALNFAASIGALDVVRLLHERRRLSKCSTSAVDDAAANGHLSVVIFLHKNREEGCTAKAMDDAAANGHLEIVKFLHENRQEGCTAKAMDGAAANGHFEIVRFLHENRQEGCTREAIDAAAKNKHCDIVRFLHTQRQEGCTREAVLGAINENDWELFQCVCENRGDGALKGALKLAVECGLLQFVKYLLEPHSSDGGEWSFWLKAYLVNVAAAKGFLDIIRFFHTHAFFQFTPTTMHNAAIGDHMEIVAFLHENRPEGCRVDTLLECDARGLGRIVKFLCRTRPMATPEWGITRARIEGRLALAALIEESARAATKTYEYT